MNVAYVSATDPVGSVGGAANTVNNWLEELQRRDVDLEVVCRGETDETVQAGDVAVHRLSGVRPRDRIEKRLAAGDYDVALVQDLWADIGLAAADAVDLPTVCSVVTTHADPEAVADFSPTRFVANSQYTSQWIAAVWGRDATVVYPHVDFEFYDVPEAPGDAVSMVNPVEMKGGETFRAVAEQFPEREFLAKGGWYSFRNGDFSWDVDALRIQGCTFHGAPPDVPDEVVLERGPTDVDFEGVENATFEPDRGILETYAATGVLLVPSLWNETFGRVVLEAMWNGIPVVASHRGGLPEACGGAGLLVDEFHDPEAWAEALRRLEDPDVYETFARQGRERARRYRDEQSDRIDDLRAVLADAATEA